MENSSYIKDRAKYAQDLERYKSVVDRALENSDEISTNKAYLNYLTDIKSELYKHIKEKSPLGELSNELYNKLHPLLVKNLKEKTSLLSWIKGLKQKIGNKLELEIISEIKNPKKEILN